MTLLCFLVERAQRIARELDASEKRRLDWVEVGDREKYRCSLFFLLAFLVNPTPTPACFALVFFLSRAKKRREVVEQSRLCDMAEFAVVESVLWSFVLILFTELVYFTRS